MKMVASINSATGYDTGTNNNAHNHSSKIVERNDGVNVSKTTARTRRGRTTVRAGKGGTPRLNTHLSYARKHAYINKHHQLVDPSA